jgi:hypothetical protein
MPFTQSADFLNFVDILEDPPLEERGIPVINFDFFLNPAPHIMRGWVPVNLLALLRHITNSTNFAFVE